MNRKAYFSWRSSLMEIVSVEERFSKTTEKPYMIVKARMVFFGNMEFSPLQKQASKSYTMMCFKESLFGLFEAGNQHIFEGELSFDWGNTWLKIMRLYDDCGNRLLRPKKTNCQDDVEEDRLTLAQRIDKDEILVQRERERRLNAGWPCTEECMLCKDLNCVVNLPY